MRTAIVLYTRDLRIADHPALAAASATAERVVPLFVLDPQILVVSARNRVAYLAEALHALDGQLRDRGGGLVLRRGDTVAEVIRIAITVGAAQIHLTDDVSAFAATRLRRLRAKATPHGVSVQTHPGITVVAPGDIRPSGGGDHYKVFTPYWKAWEATSWRKPAATPERLTLPDGVTPGGAALPDAGSEGIGIVSGDRQRGGLYAAEDRMKTWLANGVAAYGEHHDDLAGARTSRLSADLHFGCLSPLLLARAASQAQGGAPFVRQLAWRDFHHQVARAFPELPRRDYRQRQGTSGEGWHDDEDAFHAWCAGQTGVPIVDAGMRQLFNDGFMHNRARMITAAFLVRHLRVHWKRGADHFNALLTDGDIANNYGNWQWTAGTGNDTRPNRGFNPLRQARRFDPEGNYVRRHVSELADFAHRTGARATAVHEPWNAGLTGTDRYPSPLVAMD